MSRQATSPTTNFNIPSSVLSNMTDNQVDGEKIVQYAQPYLSLSIETMSNKFGVGVNQVSYFAATSLRQLTYHHPSDGGHSRGSH